MNSVDHPCSTHTEIKSASCSMERVIRAILKLALLLLAVEYLAASHAVVLASLNSSSSRTRSLSWRSLEMGSTSMGWNGVLSFLGYVGGIAGLRRSVPLLGERSGLECSGRRRDDFYVLWIWLDALIYD